MLTRAPATSNGTRAKSPATHPATKKATITRLPFRAPHIDSVFSGSEAGEAGAGVGSHAAEEDWGEHGARNNAGSEGSGEHDTRPTAESEGSAEHDAPHAAGFGNVSEDISATVPEEQFAPQPPPPVPSSRPETEPADAGFAPVPSVPEALRPRIRRHNSHEAPMLPATEKTKITKAVRPSVAIPPTTAGSEPTSSPSRNNNAQMMPRPAGGNHRGSLCQQRCSIR